MFHAAGLAPLVRPALELALPDAAVVSGDESALIFGTSQSLTDTNTLPFAGNVFAVLGTVRRRALRAAVPQLAEQLSAATFPRFSGGFRVMVHLDGQLSAIDRADRALLERVVARRTGSAVTSRGSCQEFWIIGRTGSPDLVFGARLPGRQKEKPPKGALASDLAALLVSASHPNQRDAFVDPFAGSGALVRARLASPARSILAGDADPELTAGLRAEFDGLVLTEDWDARKTTLPDGSVDAIVTDPPWGEYEELDQPYEEFVGAVADELDRVLHHVHGRVVLLAGRRISPTWQNAFDQRGFGHLETIDILVNGHPASVVIAGRRAPRPLDAVNGRRRSKASRSRR